MLQIILSLYLQSLVIAAVAMLVFCLLWLVVRSGLNKDKTLAARRGFLYDLLLIYIMTVPILSFGVIGLLLIFRV